VSKTASEARKMTAYISLKVGKLAVRDSAVATKANPILLSLVENSLVKLDKLLLFCKLTAPERLVRRGDVARG
jgi:hypothetical protein